jgi:hypothetical protein
MRRRPAAESCSAFSVGKHFRGSKSFLEDKSRATCTRLIFYIVEDLPNDIDADSAGSDVFKWAAADALRIARPSVIAKNKADPVVQAFHLQPNRLFVVAIGVPDDIGASFVQAEHEKLN